jgi:serine/threonine protein kinase
MLVGCRLTEAASRKTFRKEVGILARLRHPNIARASGIVYDQSVAEAYVIIYI